MDLSKPCECGSRSRRYTSTFNRWTCNKCKKETIDYFHPNAFIRVQIGYWFNSLPYEKKLELYLKEQQSKQEDKGAEPIKVQLYIKRTT